MGLKVKCIEKIRDKNNHIIGFKLMSNNRNVMSVKPDDLKGFIRSGQIEVTNITLTSDNRLIDKKPDAQSKPINTSSKQDINAEAIFNKAKMLGYKIDTFDTACEHKCYIASSPDNLKHIFIIPDDVEYIYSKSEDIYYNILYNYMSNIEGILRVVGGNNLISTYYMFLDCKAHSIDLRSFNTSNVTDMKEMFRECKAQSINLASFDTSKVESMDAMFRQCKAQSLDLSSFNTSNVTNMFCMFHKCEAQSLDLSSFDTSNVTNMHCMFCNCKAQSLDLTSFDTSKVTDMNHMFCECEAQSIDLSSFNTDKVTDMYAMFWACKAQINVNANRLKSQLQKDRYGGYV